MPSDPEAPKERIRLYGGPSDGATVTCSPELNHGKVPHPSNDFGPTDYVRSLPWSAHFGMPIFVPLGFPGTPPKEGALS